MFLKSIPYKTREVIETLYVTNRVKIAIFWWKPLLIKRRMTV